ncbi:stewaprin-a-like isoform X2 [Lissotriton helveticus]
MKPASVILLLVILLGLRDMLPVVDAAKPGKCPKSPCSLSSPTSWRCKSDEACTGSQKCCYIKCGFKCTEAVNKAPEEEPTGARNASGIDLPESSVP